MGTKTIALMMTDIMTPEQQIIDIVYSIRSEYYKRVRGRFSNVFRDHRENLVSLTKANPEFETFLKNFMDDVDEIFEKEIP